MSNSLGCGTQRTEDVCDPRAAGNAVTSVATTLDFADSPVELWRRLVFFEQIDRPMPIPLRWLLPRPIGVEGTKKNVGDSAICRYDRGLLVKRMTRIDPPRFYEFDVVEQSLRFAGDIRLVGGGYQLIPLSGGGTRVCLTTRYTGGYRPRWLAHPLEAFVCHAFHRFVLRSLPAARADEDERPSHGEAA